MTLLPDASPLIYLAKVEALDALDVFDRPAIVREVQQEVVAPGLGYRFPDALTIERAIQSGRIEVIAATPEERQQGNALVAEAGGLHRGEAVTIAVAVSRQWPVCVFERQARTLARAVGVEVIDPVEVLFAGTTDNDLLNHRVRRFGELVNLRLEALESLLSLIEDRR